MQEYRLLLAFLPNKKPAEADSLLSDFLLKRDLSRLALFCGLDLLIQPYQ